MKLIYAEQAIDALRKRMDKSAKGEIGSFYNAVIIRNIEVLESLPPAKPAPCEFCKHNNIADDKVCLMCPAERRTDETD